MPADDGVGLNEDQRRPPAASRAGEQDPEHVVRGAKARPLDVLLQGSQLLTADLIVTIGETERVERAALARAVAPAMDDALVASALRWEYQPALRDGSPVKYAKIVRVEIT
jgi:hypothetical protein